jgi:hypothetical protein
MKYINKLDFIYFVFEIATAYKAKSRARNTREYLRCT